MNVRLKPELQKFIDDEVKSGNFASADEVIEAGLARLMLDPAPNDSDPGTLAAIDEAEAQLDRGEGLPLDEAFARLRKKHFAE
jgi:putative addiction module CopG family antidote